jgi:hypothetical protein
MITPTKKSLDLQFAGIQVKNSFESVPELVWLFMQAAIEHDLKFEVVEVFGMMTVGTSKFLRFRTDCPNLPATAARLMNEGRGSIMPDNKGGYRIRLPDGREGPIPVMSLQAVALPGFPQSFRGPKIKFWTKQFENLEIVKDATTKEEPK